MNVINAIVLFQIFIIQWMNAAYDYILQVYDDLLYSNWYDWVCLYVNETRLILMNYLNQGFRTNRICHREAVRNAAAVFLSCLSLFKARDDAHPVADLLSALHSLWHCHYSGLQVRSNSVWDILNTMIRLKIL